MGFAVVVVVDVDVVDEVVVGCVVVVATAPVVVVYGWLRMRCQSHTHTVRYVKKNKQTKKES